MWTVLITLLVGRHILPERLLAFFTHENHLHCLPEGMCLRFTMTFGAIVPSLAAWSADRDLSIQDVFTAGGEVVQSLVHYREALDGKQTMANRWTNHIPKTLDRHDGKPASMIY
jgi:hypothetical protein